VNVYLSLQKLIKMFGAVRAVDGVDLDINRSEFICILGPSGCGKTTLLRMIAGLEKPDSGIFLFDNKDYTSVPERLRHFGMVFQSYSLFPNLTIAENVAYGLHCRSWTNADISSRVREMLDLVDLADQRDKYQTQLSGGQQQRIALARALAPRPHVLLLDEPLSALDAKVRRSLRQEVRKLQRTLNITTIMVTHDQEEALTMADRVVVMDKGRIVQIGTPTEVYDSPATPFVAEFVGQMNFLSAISLGSGSARVGDLVLNFSAGNANVPHDGPILLAVRPEDVHLEANMARPAANSIAATVRWVEFLGNICRTNLDLPGGRAITAELAPHVARAMQLSEGQHVHVSLPSAAIRTFRA
jgi:iron(III) transport system ATP-binding protein